MTGDDALYSTMLRRLRQGDEPLPDSVEDQSQLASAVKDAWQCGKIRSVRDVRCVAEKLDARRLADRLKSNDLKVLFVRQHAARYPAVWADLFETCYHPARRRYSRHALRRLTSAAGGGGKMGPSCDVFLPAKFQEWAERHRLALDPFAGGWLQALAFRLRRTRALPWELHDSFDCGECAGNAPGHKVGSHWAPSLAAYPADRDVQKARENGLSVPYRKRRAAEVAIEALIRNNFDQQNWQAIAETFSEKNESRSGEAIRELALDAAHLLGFPVRGIGRPRENKD